jgi:hypothetical protein
MSEVTFTTVQRPTKTAGGFPVKLAAAIEATLTSGMSVRKANGLYRLAFAHGKTTPFVLQRRRTKTELYFWAEARRAQ